MLFKTTIICVFCFASVLVGGLASELEDLPLGTMLKSPDSRFTVHYVYTKEDARPVYRIQNNETGEIYKSIVALPCYLMKWTSDSNNVLCVEMMSDGYHAKIIHFDRGSWVSFYPEDLIDEKFVGSSVVDIKILKNIISITRVARNENPNKSHSFICFKVTYLLDPEKKKILKSEKTAISEDEYLDERYSLKK